MFRRSFRRCELCRALAGLYCRRLVIARPMHKLTCAFGAATLPAIGGSPMLGKMLGHYRIVEKIGEGGMGAVYLAHDERLDRDVAIKVLPPGVLSDESVRSRFRNEAVALAKLNHPNIAIIHDFDAQ